MDALHFSIPGPGHALLLLWNVALSLLLFRMLEAWAERVCGKRLSWWRRMLIPLPALLLYAANLDAVLSLSAWLDSHPQALPIRYVGNFEWSAGRFIDPAFLGLLVVPFLITLGCRARLVSQFDYVGKFAGLHVPYAMLVHWPLWLSTGFPFRD
jgi:hypothetical protein